jgi:hypothetical protein
MKKFVILFSLFLFHFFLLNNLQFTAWPEILSFPYLLKNGFSLYSDFVHPYPPLLTYVLNIWYQIFGLNLESLKLFTYIVIFLSDILLFKIIKKFYKSDNTAYLSLLLYIPLQSILDGNMLWFDLAIVPLILSTIYFILEKKYLLSGLLLALAIFTKQTTGLYLLLLLPWIITTDKKIINTIKFTLPIFTICGSYFIYLATDNNLINFLNWTLIYPLKYWSSFPGYVDFNLSNRQIVIIMFLCLHSFIGSVILFKSQKKLSIFLLFNLLISLILIYPRFSFFHAQLFIAISIVLTAPIFLNKYTQRLIPFTIIILFYFLYPYLKTSWQKEARFYSPNEIILSQQIKKVSSSNSIYLHNMPSHYYALGNFLPPKPWVDNYIWYWEIPNVQQNTIERWTKNPAESVVLSPFQSGNWYDLGTYKPKQISNWLESNYNKTYTSGSGLVYLKHK